VLIQDFHRCGSRPAYFEPIVPYHWQLQLDVCGTAWNLSSRNPKSEESNQLLRDSDTVWQSRTCSAVQPEHLFIAKVCIQLSSRFKTCPFERSTKNSPDAVPSGSLSARRNSITLGSFVSVCNSKQGLITPFWSFTPEIKWLRCVTEPKI
jgi:hypothetical protein